MLTGIVEYLNLEDEIKIGSYKNGKVNFLYGGYMTVGEALEKITENDCDWYREGDVRPVDILMSMAEWLGIDGSRYQNLGNLFNRVVSKVNK